MRGSLSWESLRPFAAARHRRHAQYFTVSMVRTLAVEWHCSGTLLGQAGALWRLERGEARGAEQGLGEVGDLPWVGRFLHCCNNWYH